MDPGRKIRFLRRKDDPSKFMSEADLYKAAEGIPEREGKNPAQWFDYYAKEHGDTYEPFDASALSAFGDMARNAPRSVGGVLSGVWDAVTSPVKTANAFASLVTGQDWVYAPGEEGEQVFRGAEMRQALMDGYKSRYGSMEAIGNTIRTDPAGVLSDIALVPTGAGLAAKGASTALRVGGKLAAKAGAKTVASKATKAASRASGAGRAAMQAADAIDPATVIPMAAASGVSAATRPVRARITRGLHDTLFSASGGLHTAEDIRAAQRLAWEEGVGPGPGGQRYIDSQMQQSSAVRDRAVDDVMASGRPSSMYVNRFDIVEPNQGLMARDARLRPLSALWDDAAKGRQGDAMNAHTGYFEAANQFMGEKTGGRFALDPSKRPTKGDVSGVYENAPYTGEFEPVELASGGATIPAALNEPALQMTVQDVNEMRKAANVRQTQFDAAQAGKMDEATSTAMRRQQANFQMNNNARSLLYMKFEDAGITPPAINGKKMTWKELGERDRTLMNLDSMIEAAQKELATKGRMAHLSPYYWSSLATTGYAGMGGAAGTPLATMVAAIATAKTVAAFAPDTASKILRYVGGQYKNAPKPVWAAVRAGVHAAQGAGRNQKLIDKFLDEQIMSAPEPEAEQPDAAGRGVPAGIEPSPY